MRLDTDVKNVSRIDQLNPIILPFLQGERSRDKTILDRAFGFNYATKDGRTSIHGGYGIYYDRITFEIQSLERGLDGRALPIEVRAGNVFFIPPPFLFDPVNGTFPPGAPTFANPFTGFILPGAGASGINIIDNTMQNPMVQQMNFGVQREFADLCLACRLSTQLRHAFHHRPHDRHCFQSGCWRARLRS